mgnify:CR=1 FL=1|jgi:hypothetical protein
MDQEITDPLVDALMWFSMTLSHREEQQTYIYTYATLPEHIQLEH